MPEELPAVRTVITLPQALQALHDAWKKSLGAEPKKESLWLLAAHWGFETGWGKSMWCYNFGNAKHVEGDGRDWTYFKCSEILGGKVQYFEPKHPTSAFRAFRTLLEGAEDYFDLIHKRFKAAWPAVEAGDPRQYAHALKQQRYYTDDEEHYTKTMVGCYSHAKAAKWDPGTPPELPKEAHPEIGAKDPFGAHLGADVCIAAYERAIGAQGFKLDAENEKNWKVEDHDLGPGAFEKLQPGSGDLVLLATADGPRSGRVLSVAAAVGKTYEGSAIFAAGMLANGVGVQKLQLETRPNGFNANGGEEWKADETRPGAGKAWALRVLRLSEATPDKLKSMPEAELTQRWHILKGEVIPSPATDLRWDAKKKPNDPTLVDEELKEAPKDGPEKKKKKEPEPDDNPAAFKTPPEVVALPPPKQVDARTVSFKVGNYPGRIAFTIRKPGEPLPVCPPPGAPAAPAAEGKRDEFIRAAMNMLGVPFAAGGRDPAKGLDGAGLIGLCMKRVGLLKEGDELPDASGIHGLFGAIGGKPDEPPEEIIPGDLAWFGKGDHDTDAQQHCMVYLGGGRVLGPIADGGPQNGAVQVIAAKAVPEHFAGWTHISDLGRDTGHTAHPGHPPADGESISSALVPASPAARYDLMKALVAKKGGAWQDEKGKVNVVTVRSMHGRCAIAPKDDDYNDTLFACFLDADGHKCSLELRASVNPGHDAEKANKWHLLDGSYKFKLDKDGDQKVLRPDGSVKAWFDEHGQGSLRPGDLADEPEAKEAKGPAPTKEEDKAPKTDGKKDEPKEEANEEKKKDEPDAEDKAYDYFKKLITETVKGLVESGKLKCAKPPVEFAEADGAINIIGIRSMTDWVAGTSEDNAYDDWLVQVWKEGGEKRVEGFKATVDPGKYWRDHPMNKSGAAHLMEGQWRYTLGTHKGEPAGNQAAEVTVWRDKAGTGQFQENFDTGWFGINNHHGGSDYHNVGQWSAGCQVVFTGKPNRWNDYIAQLKKAKNAKDYPYTLIDSKDLPGPIPVPEHHKPAAKSTTPKPDPKKTPKDTPAADGGAKPDAPAPKPKDAPPPSEKVGEWEEYADGRPLPAELAEKIKAERAKFPEIKLTDMGGKFKGKDHYQYLPPSKEHRDYLQAYMKARIEKAASKVEGFAAKTFRDLLGQEGSTSSWNTYDNQIVTWGTGFGAVGALPLVLNEINKSEGTRERLRAVGFAWSKKEGYFIADLENGKVVKSTPGKSLDHHPPANAWRAQKDLLAAMSGLAEHPDTRDVITEAFFIAYKTNSASFAADAINGDGLFGLVSHLHHWYPGYAGPAWKAARESAGGGSPSVQQDMALAKALVKRFYTYGNEQLAKHGSGKMNESQLRGYVVHAKKIDMPDLETDFSFEE